MGKIPTYITIISDTMSNKTVRNTEDCPMNDKKLSSRQDVHRHTKREHGGSSAMPGYVLLTKEPIWLFQCSNVNEFMRPAFKLLSTWTDELQPNVEEKQMVNADQSPEHGLSTFKVKRPRGRPSKLSVDQTHSVMKEI